MKDMKDLQKAVIEKAAASRPQEITEEDADALLGGAMKVNKLGDVLANLDVDELLKDNESSAKFISDEIERAETLLKAKQKVPVAEAVLRTMIERNRKQGVLVDTQAIKDLRAWINAAKELRVGDEVDEAALEVLGFRKFYTEIQDAADVVRSLLEGTKAEAEAKVDGLVDKYQDFFERLWGHRHVKEVPDNILKEWKKRHVSFSNYAFSAKNHEGKKIWCWGIKGDEKSMAVAKTMRRFYADLDTLLYRLKKADKPATEATPPTTPAEVSAPQQE